MSEKHTENRRAAPRTAWKPGQTGNPKGRPRLGNSLAECLRDYLEATDKGKLARKQELVAKLYHAATGDNCVPAQRLIFEVLGGMHVEAQLKALLETLERMEAKK